MRSAAPQRGFSLVEIMIATTLGLVLLAGLSQMFVSSKQGYRVQESGARMQENARFAMEYLSRAIRQADFWGGAPASEMTAISSGLADGAASACSEAWMTDFARAVQGWQGAAASPLANCTVTAYVPHSDVLALRYADPDGYISDAELADGDGDETSNGRSIVRALVGRNAVLFNHADRSVARSATSGIEGAEAEGALNYRYAAYVFFLRNFTAVVGGPATPSLYWRRLDSGGTTESQQLVEGIEQLKFSYGIDSDGDRVADRYKEAGAVTTAEWAGVLSVRISLLVRGDQLDSYSDDQTYPMTASYTYTPAAEARRFQRRLFIRDVQIRNRVRG